MITVTIPAHQIHRAAAPVTVRLRDAYPCDPANGQVRAFVEAATVLYGVHSLTPRQLMAQHLPTGMTAQRMTAEALLADNGVGLDAPATPAGEITGRAIRAALARPVVRAASRKEAA